MILETDRLLLREFTINDCLPLQAVLGDPVAMQFYPAAFDRQAVEDWITKNIKRYRNDGYGLWAMILTSSGELIGDCGCVLQEVEGHTEIEIGYHVRRDLWGNGYATEAAKSCMEYAFAKLGAGRVVSMIRPENLSSRRVAEKNGLTSGKTAFWHGYQHCMYASNRTDLEQGAPFKR